LEKSEAIRKLQQLIGKELHELAEQFGVTIYSNEKVNKGWAGHVFERYLGLPINSAQSPNFGSWELKSVPLKYKMIDPVNVCQKDFEESHLLAKLKKVVVVARIVGATVDEPSYIHSVTEFNLSSTLYEAVKADYDLVRNTLLDANKGFEALTGEMGFYIQPRTKGAGHGSTSRAFYARKRFLAEFITL